MASKASIPSPSPKARKGVDGSRVSAGEGRSEFASPLFTPRGNAQALLHQHEGSMQAVSELFEHPDVESHGAAAAGMRRAASAGHTWLTRISCRTHAEKLVQPALLGSVRPPSVTYVPAVPRRIGKTGALSELQIEALLYAGQCHSQPLRPSGTRNGFLLADGAGVGKGRTQAAIILDAWLQGHQKALWVSASADLLADAKRDLEAVSTSMAGMPQLHNMLISLTSLPVNSPISAPQGVLYASYALLARPARLAQVIAWCQARKPFEGVLALDESHRAKAAGSTGAGAAVLRLQAELPIARVVYASATSATELHNMQYLIRLGLWGAGTPYPSFSAFRDEMQIGGSAAKELLPVHLKMCGALVSRILSYDGVRVRVAVHKLSETQRKVYNASATLWQQLAGELISRSHLLPPTSGSRFWSAHQRFFRSLVTASKLPTLHEILGKALEEGKSVVVGLLGTGEAYCNADSGEGNSNLPPAPSSILRSVVTSVLFPDCDPTSQMVRKWLMQIDDLALPSNPLDDIMTTLSQKGVEAVELSGRQEVAGQRNAARERFQSSEAIVAVISDAASTGVSLHAPPAVDGVRVRPRLHITLELNWSADRQIQQLGRTHRTGQACPPEHVLLVSDICGEKRFVSTVARRLQSLGALSGDGGGGGSRVAEGRWGDVLESLETAQGSAALLQLYASLGFSVFNSETESKELRRAQIALRCFLRQQVRVKQSSRSICAVEVQARDHNEEAEDKGGDGTSVGRVSSSEGEEEMETESDGVEWLEGEGEGEGEGAPSLFQLEDAKAHHKSLRNRLQSAVCELLPDFSSEQPAPALPRNKASSVTLFLNRLLGIGLEEQSILLSFFKFLLRGEVWRARRNGLLDGGVQALPSPVAIRSVQKLDSSLLHSSVGATCECPQLVLELATCAEGCVLFESLTPRNAAGIDGFYACEEDSHDVAYIRQRAAKAGVVSCLHADGSELEVALSRVGRDYVKLDNQTAAARWRRDLAATVDADEPSLFLVCGPMLHLLPLFNRIAASRNAVHRATLISGHTVVGFMLSKEQISQLLDEGAPSTVSPEEEVVSESQQRWSSQLEEMLVAQRQLQSKLPPFDDDKAWEECWATIRKHELDELEPDEIQEQQQRQADLRDFQSQILKRKKEQARYSHTKARPALTVSSAAKGIRQPPPLDDAPPARRVVHQAPKHIPCFKPVKPALVAPNIERSLAGASGVAAASAAAAERVDAPTVVSADQAQPRPPGVPSANQGESKPSSVSSDQGQAKPVHTSCANIAPKRATFRPTVSAVRTSAAAQRAAAQSKLHPLLQKASENTSPSPLP